MGALQHLNKQPVSAHDVQAKAPLPEACADHVLPNPVIGKRLYAFLRFMMIYAYKFRVSSYSQALQHASTKQ